MEMFVIERKKVIESDSYKETVLINEAYFSSLFKDIQNAKISIDLNTYIFAADTLGLYIVELLSAAVRRGVTVRVLIDGMGSRFCSKETINRMKAAGISVRIYHPMPWTVWQWGKAAHAPTSFMKRFIYLLTKINSRNHRKLCIIDHSIVYVSSANIDKCHLHHGDGGDGWRDTTVRLTGLDPFYLEYGFYHSWTRYFARRKLKPLSKIHGGNSIFYLNFTRKERNRIYEDILSRINNCQQRIWITSAYFVPDSHLLNALIKAAQRNVNVCILLPSKSDVLISSLVANTFYSTLLKNNVSIFEYTESILHAKIMILDDWCLLGSSNLNSRSLKHDLEVDVALQTKEAKDLLEKHFLTDISNSQQINMTHLKKQSFLKTILGRILLFIHYWM